MQRYAAFRSVQYPVLWVLSAIVCLAVLALVSPESQVQAQPQERCFAETGYCISGRILTFWEQNGGLPVFGLPISALQGETIEGQEVQVQWFERNRLELHPDNEPPYDVLLGRLGTEVLEAAGRDWRSFPPGEPRAECRQFAETGHSVCGEMLTMWRAYGLEFDGRVGNSKAENLALFGLPLSSAQTEQLSDGREYTVQWFERARFELHPEEAPPFRVQLGLLASELRPDLAPSGAEARVFRYVFPVNAETLEYGPYHHDYPATDIFCPPGNEFLATTDGVVDYVSRVDQWDAATNRPEHRGGIAVAIVGDDGWRYYGSHLSGLAENIEPGVRVSAGQLLGWTGSSGNARSTPPHVHYGISRPTTPDDWEVRRGQIPPYDYLQAWARGEMVTPSP